jgi:hypothetical protein
VTDSQRKDIAMNEMQQKISLAIGSAAAAAAIFAPLNYSWKGILTTVATGAILSGVFGVSPKHELQDLSA